MTQAEKLGKTIKEKAKVPLHQKSQGMVISLPFQLPMPSSNADAMVEELIKWKIRKITRCFLTMNACIRIQKPSVRLFCQT